MSDIYNDIAGVTFQKPVCRVAYTLNNTQPVVCTIIDDQPLFYLDFESDFEDETFFDDADLNILENEINTMSKDIKALDKRAETQIRSTEEKIFEFLDDANQITSGKNSNADVKALIKTLETSRLAKAYLECAKENNVELIYSSQIQSSHYDRNTGLIMINPLQSMDLQILSASRELRRHWQHRQGAFINPLMFHPDSAVLVNRVQVADLITSMIRISWELQLSGEKAAWDAIENSTFDDLGRAFAREAYLDFRTINNGQASAAVFEAWFLSERPRAEDKTLINQMLADHKGFVFDLDENEKQITPQLICALGEMPFGKNYLAEHAITIMDDAIFTDIRDRSNANFLWFIKFERSFRETEQELQTSEGPSAEASYASAQHPTQDLTDETAQQSAEIVRLFEGDTLTDQEHGDNSPKSGKRLSPKSKSGRKSKQASNVVYLRRWSGE